MPANKAITRAAGPSLSDLGGNAGLRRVGRLVEVALRAVLLAGPERAVRAVDARGQRGVPQHQRGHGDAVEARVVLAQVAVLGGRRARLDGRGAVQGALEDGVVGDGVDVARVWVRRDERWGRCGCELGRWECEVGPVFCQLELRASSKGAFDAYSTVVVFVGSGSEGEGLTQVPPGWLTQITWLPLASRLMLSQYSEPTSGFQLTIWAHDTPCAAAMPLHVSERSMLS